MGKTMEVKRGKRIGSIAKWLRHRLASAPPSSKLVALAVLVGFVAGLGAIAFDVSGQVVGHFAATRLAGYAPPEADGEHHLFSAEHVTLNPVMLVIVMAVGGVLSGAVVFFFAPEAEGHGTDAAIDAFHNKRGVIRGRVPFVKTLASIITLGTGGSGGREGPIAQIGAGFGSWLAQRLSLPHRDQRVLLAAGMGAGVGAIFRAPLAGAVFAGEILYSDADLEADALVPATASSIVAYSVYTQSIPAQTRFLPLFGNELHHSFQSPVELVPYSLLAVALTLIGMIYVKVFYGTHDAFSRWHVAPFLKPSFGAAAAGLLGVLLISRFSDNQAILGVLGTGYGSLQAAISNASDVGIPLLLTIAVGKIATTSLTIGSGGSGGVFGPSMVIGGTVGAAIGLAFQQWIPGIVDEPEAFAVVGMAGFFSGVARAPLSTIIIVRAMTGDFGLLVPTMLVSTITFVLSRPWKLYRKQLPTRLESPAHRGDFIVDVLEGLNVEDVYEKNRRIQLIDEGMTLNEIVHRLPSSHQHYFPVIDENRHVVGVFSDDDIRSYLFDDQLWDLVVARDLMVEDFLYVTPDHDLNTALRRFTTKNLEELPVLSPDDESTFLGMLRRKSVIAAYNRKLLEHKKASLES